MLGIYFFFLPANLQLQCSEHFLIKGLDEKESKGNTIETMRFCILKAPFDFPLYVSEYMGACFDNATAARKYRGICL